MSKSVKGVLYFAFIALFIAGFSLPVMGQINVTVNFNSSTVLDTLSETDFVQLRGEIVGVAGDNDPLPGNDTIRWGNTSTLIMDNVGGDYWTITFQMNPGDTIMYKIWPGHDKDTGTHPNGGWEGDFEVEIAAINTRWFIAGESDSTLPLQYYHPSTAGVVNQFSRPFESKEDSIAVYFMVNMAGELQKQGFPVTELDTVAVRGDSTASAGVLHWSYSQVVLNWETNSRDSMFYSGVMYIPTEKAGTSQPYKFVYHRNGAIGWESSADRFMTYPAQDTTLHWDYFSQIRPTTEEPVEATVIWRLSTEALESVGLFDRGVGDEIEIRGPKGWDANQAIELNFVPALQEWTVGEPFNTIPGTVFDYKYFIGWDSSRVDSESPNYVPMLNIDQGWEEPGVTGGGNRTYTYGEEAQQFPEGDFGFARQFFNSVPPNGVIPHDIAVTFNVDMTNAANVATNPDNPDDLFRSGTDTVMVQFDGELIAWTQGYEMWGEPARVIELKDPDEDMVYSGTLNFTVSALHPAVWYQIGYVIVYSTDVKGTWVQNGGGGVDIGRRYLQYIIPTSIGEKPPGSDFPATTWPTEYDLAVAPWTWRNLLVEDPPDLTTPQAIGDKSNTVREFALHQNYPNPFNPTTTISYQIAKSSDVKISVYNIAGQLVHTIVNENQIPGKYTVVWDGKNGSGENVASGIYFLKMNAGEFSKVRKMTLIR